MPTSTLPRHRRTNLRRQLSFIEVTEPNIAALARLRHHSAKPREALGPSRRLIALARTSLKSRRHPISQQRLHRSRLIAPPPRLYCSVATPMSPPSSESAALPLFSPELRHHRLTAVTKKRLQTLDLGAIDRRKKLGYWVDFISNPTFKPNWIWVWNQIRSFQFNPHPTPPQPDPTRLHLSLTKSTRWLD